MRGGWAGSSGHTEQEQSLVPGQEADVSMELFSEKVDWKTK